ncbi:MAG: hypothetical protein II452_00945, partial [Paludibacteraceae bacterium]|nr:hypothetical protein [Paludibacteraceae bacterium]
MDRVKSRISPMNHRLWTVIAPMLFVAFCLFGVNESAWGAWTGSGSGTLKNGVWYAYYDVKSNPLLSIGVKKSSTINLKCPGKALTFDAKNSA